MRSVARAFALASFLLIAACAKTVQVTPQPPPPTNVPPPVIPPPPPPPANARAAGVTLVAPPAAYLNETSAARALKAFLISCPALQRRQDKSLLSNGADWSGVCTEATQVQTGGAVAFFRDRFDWVRIGDSKAFATGYYIPETAGSRTPGPGYAVPVYRTPPDLVRCTKADGTTGRGRIERIDPTRPSARGTRRRAIDGHW